MTRSLSSAVPWVVGGAVAAAVVAAAVAGRGAPPDTPPPKGGAPPPGGSDLGAYVTPIDDVRMHESGWAPLGNGLEITAVPLVPAHPPEGIVFARLSWADARILAARWGVEMLTEQVGAIAFARGLRLEPCTLWVPGGDIHMRSLAWCQKHDACVARQLAARWDGKQAVADAGKDWIVEPGRGGAINWGWHDARGRVIQPPGHAHEPSYTDYSQLTRFFRRV